MTRDNRQIRLINRPVSMIEASNFDCSLGEIQEPKDGEVLVRVKFLSVDPYMRGRMSDRESYADPFPLNEVLLGGAVGVIIKSLHPKFEDGDYVLGLMGWEEFSTLPGNTLRKIDGNSVPLEYHLSVLGMPGSTAYAGLVDIADVKEGDTVFITAASGAVGSAAGQIAKILGARVAGCAGSDEKVEYIREDLGFDAAFNYRKVDSLSSAIADACPNGIDVIFENVGGAFLDAGLAHMNMFGRIALCGMISNYNDGGDESGPKGFMDVIAKRLTIRGFLVGDHRDASRDYFKRAPQWVRDGQLKSRHTIYEGLEKAPEALIGLFIGTNVGKQLVRVD